MFIIFDIIILMFIILNKAQTLIIRNNLYDYVTCALKNIYI